ncbi:peptidylprolyl isomerase [Comamonas aquatica]|jgi:peptidyl-prolyl cis-trans isomerase SurA|uniref:Chaperone SurA n=2 Tax=Comamonas aquatica TaxID=225991 RepID=A0AA42L115_9BURK|nr:peptidylprolyl isomerase [Comamonas aquatica]MDH0200114.1 peptidylprolyl isomerase [Comamonas aquatica]MDH0362043.1 peptidylprolyl isomerase [Comamonas aquatica]MDH0371011.1 peptidylprolyl isomerase [Comamonas aquatica]MDH1446172.1 peptidylprolyl isomerase [Comamonas aquatica]MDH1673308.1 peptidylprolyl isomerase [Comamonas aquatica]
MRQPGAQDLSRALSSSIQPAPRAPEAAGLRSADYIVAIVNSEPVTNNEVRARMRRVLQAMQAQGARQTPDQDELAREVLERLIVEKAQIQTAKETGIKVDDYAVDQAIQNLARQNGMSADAMRREMAGQGVTEKMFRDEIRNQMLMQRLQEREVDGRVRVSEQDIDRYMAEQRSQGGQTDMANSTINLGHILITVPERASPAEVAQRQALAEQALQAARSEPDFATVARRFSEGGQAILGMRPANRYPSLFIEAVGTTPVGGVVGPIRSAAGFHILKVVDKSANGVAAVVTQNHARHILLRTSPQLGEREAAQQLLELRQRLDRGARFEDLARQYSEDGSAASGGDLGWAGPGRYVPEFEQALNALQPGQVSQPVVSRFGVHLIQLVERRQATLTPREQREMLRDVVREQKLEKAQATWLQELRGQAYVEYREPPQ